MRPVGVPIRFVGVVMDVPVNGPSDGARPMHRAAVSTA